jgi:hypothetical protein
MSNTLPNINAFKASLLKGGARANYFRVQSPNIGTTKINFSFLCRAASLPAAAVNVVEVKTPGGRTMKYSGERTFENWNVTVYNDTDMILREQFEKWQTGAADWDSPIALDVLDSYASSVGWYVSQLDRAGRVVRSYNFFNMWCANLGAIDLTFDDAGSIEEFTVELAFSHYVPVDSTKATTLGQLVSTPYFSANPLNVKNAINTLGDVADLAEALKGIATTTA